VLQVVLTPVSIYSGFAPVLKCYNGGGRLENEASGVLLASFLKGDAVWKMVEIMMSMLLSKSLNCIAEYLFGREYMLT
jgi:hypothetical protein